LGDNSVGQLGNQDPSFTAFTSTPQQIYLDCQSNGHHCLTCAGSDASDCTSCQPGYFPQGVEVSDTFTCVDECDASYYWVAGLQMCLPCSTDCTTCQYTSTNCVTCPVDQFVLAGSCVTSCPDGTYDQTYASNTRCYPCDRHCLTCSGSGSDACLTCQQGKFLNTDGTCDQCLPNCGDCTGVGQCTTCRTGYTLNVGLGPVCIPSTSAGGSAVSTPNNKHKKEI